MGTVTASISLRRSRLAWAAFVVGSSAVAGSSAVGSYGVRALTALAVAGLLLRGAGGAALCRARRLLAGALLAGAVSGGVATLHVVVTGAPAPVGSWTDVLQLVYVPLAVAGLVSIPSVRGERVRTIADTAVAAGSLWYLTVALILEPHGVGDGLAPLARLVALGYLLGPPLVIGVLLSLLQGTSGQARSFLVRTAAGMGLLSAAEVCFALAAWNGDYEPGGLMAALHQAGLAVLLHTVASRAAGCASAPSGRAPHRQTLAACLPYLPLVAASTTAVWQYVGGGGFTRPQTLPVVLTGVAVVVRHGAAVHAHAALVRDLERRERHARQEALRDPLTGLANRRALVDRLGAMLGDPAAHPVAVAVLDLNDFKHVNDNHGHGTGDRLLELCAERLVAALAPGCVVARLGGDEFALCQPSVDDGGVRLVDQVLAAFEAPFVVGRRRFTVRPSVGAVVDERDAGRGTASDAAHLLAHADVAMYQAKSAKRLRSSPAVILAGADRERAAGIIGLREEISEPALEQFANCYQPIVDLMTGALVGVEALVRWRHPTYGDVDPAQLVALAEQVGSIGVLGEHVLATALGDLAAWSRIAPDHRLTMSVNLSPRQLADPDLAASVVAQVDAAGTGRDRLVLEITEGALMEQFDTAVSVVAALRAAGVSVAVDDFGTGHSSLRYLRRFDADVIKIDQEFVKATPTEERTATLVRLVVEMAAALRLRTVAEGIETPAQLRAVQELGCQLGQGFLFSRPVPAAGIADLVRTGHRYPTGLAVAAG